MASPSEIACFYDDIERLMTALNKQSDTITKTVEQCLQTIQKTREQCLQAIQTYKNKLVNPLLIKPLVNSPEYCEQHARTSNYITYTFKPYPERDNYIYTGIQYVLIRRASVHPTIHILELVIYGTTTMDMVREHFKTAGITLPNDTGDTLNQEFIDLIQFFRANYGYSNTYYLVETEEWYRMCCSTMLSSLGERGMSIMSEAGHPHNNRWNSSYYAALYTPPNYRKFTPSISDVLEKHFSFYKVPYEDISLSDHTWNDWEEEFSVKDVDNSVGRFILNTPDHQNYLIKSPIKSGDTSEPCMLSRQYQYHKMLYAKDVPYLKFLPEDHFNQCPLIIAGFYSNGVNSDLGVIIYTQQEKTVTDMEVCAYVLYYLLHAGYDMDELVTGFSKDEQWVRDERYLTAYLIKTGDDYMSYNIRGLNVSTSSIISKLSNKSE